ncbi:hypothetical protein ACFLXZ_00370 [Chloroflexota bacterium]
MSEEAGRETHVLKRPGYVFRVTAQGKSRSMRICEGDYDTISVYSNIYGKPRTTILHEMIGTAAKCWEEKHDEQLPELQEWKDKTKGYELMARILELYKQKYGRLHVMRRKQQENDKKGAILEANRQ